METGLNGVRIPLPAWYVRQTESLHQQLKRKLSAQDYTEVLMGELGRLCYEGEFMTPAEARSVVPDLTKALKAIVEKQNADFDRACFHHSHTEGITSRELLNNAMGDAFGADEHYIVTRSRGGSIGYSALLQFWDSRSLRLAAAWNAPSLIYSYSPTPKGG